MQAPFDLPTFILLVGHVLFWVVASRYRADEGAALELVRTLREHAVVGAVVIVVLAALCVLGWLLELVIARGAARRRVIGSAAHAVHVTAHLALFGVLAIQTLWALTIASTDWALNDPPWVPELIPRWLSLPSMGLIWAANLMLCQILFVVSREAWEIFRTAYGSLLVARDYPKLGAAVAEWKRAGDTPQENPEVAILVVSDTHIRQQDEPTLEHGAIALGSLAASLAHWITVHEPNLLLHCGDVTDVGSVDDAAAALAMFRGVAAAGRDVPRLVAPGNHDIHFKTAEARARSWYGTHDAAHVASWLGKLWNPPPPWERDPGQEPGYPQLIVAELAIPVRVLLLDSNRRPSGSVTTNAIGHVGEEQLAQAVGMLRATPAAEAPLIIVLHHHVGVPANPGKESWFDRVTRQALVCLDADRVLALAHDYHAIAVLHGHQHYPFIATHQRSEHQVVVVSCGSARYPAKGPCRELVQHPSCAVLRVDRGGLRSAKFDVAVESSLEGQRASSDPVLEAPGEAAYRVPAGMSQQPSLFARIPMGLLQFLLPVALYVLAVINVIEPLVPPGTVAAPLYPEPSATRTQLVVRDLGRYLDERCADADVRRSFADLARNPDPDLEMFDRALLHFARDALEEDVFAYAPLAWRASRMILTASPAYNDAEQLQLELTNELASVSTYLYHRSWSSRSSCALRGNPLEDPPLP